MAKHPIFLEHVLQDNSPQHKGLTAQIEIMADASLARMSFRDDQRTIIAEVMLELLAGRLIAKAWNEKDCGCDPTTTTDLCDTLDDSPPEPGGIEDMSPDELSAFEWDAQPVPMVCLTNAPRANFEAALFLQQHESRPDAVETTLRGQGFVAVVGYKHARPAESLPPTVTQILQQPPLMEMEEYDGAKALADASPEMLALVRDLSAGLNADDMETAQEQAQALLKRLQDGTDGKALTVASRRLVSRQK